ETGFGRGELVATFSRESEHDFQELLTMIQRVLVLGGGSAGFLAAISLKRKLPDLQVSVVRSKEMGVIGVGEATTFAFPNYLHGRLRIEPGEFHRQAQPTWKLGIRFLHWG